jgi:hypothetical protein
VTMILRKMTGVAVVVAVAADVAANVIFDLGSATESVEAGMHCLIAIIFGKIFSKVKNKNFRQL